MYIIYEKGETDAGNIFLAQIKELPDAFEHAQFKSQSSGGIITGKIAVFDKETRLELVLKGGKLIAIMLSSNPSLDIDP